MNWISITLNVVERRKHTQDFTFNLTETEFASATCAPAGVAPREEGLCQCKRGRSIHEGAEESQQAVSVEVIMRH